MGKQNVYFIDTTLVSTECPRLHYNNQGEEEYGKQK